MNCEPEGPPDSSSMLPGNGGSASTTERLLLMVLRQQEVIMTRMDQLQKTVHTIALDVEDVRTGCLEFFDEYRLEYLPDTAALLGGSQRGSPAGPSCSGHEPPSNPPSSGSPTIKTSLSPVNWSKSKPMNAPTTVSSRRTSPDEDHSPYQVYAPTENLGGPSTPGSGSFHDEGTVNALRRAVFDILAFPVAPHKVSPETPRGRPTRRLPNDPFSPTPAHNSQTHSRLSLSHQPSPPASNPSATPTHVLPLNDDDRARVHSPVSDSTVTGPPGTPSASFPPECVNEVAAEGSHDDSTFNQYVNHDIWDSTSHDTITTRIRTPQSHPVSLPGGDRETTPTSSEADALLAEAHLFQDASLPPPCIEPAQPDDPPSGLDQIKLELQSLMFASSPLVPPRPETVDPSDLNAMSPLTSLSPTPDPTPSPEAARSALTAGRFGMKFAGASTQGKHPAATRIKKRKAKPTSEGNLRMPESDEPPSKRAKQPAVPAAVCLREIQTQGETQSPLCPVSWPAVTTANDGFARKVVMCDSCLWWYHYGCVGIVNKGDKRIKRKAVFLCPVCLVYPETALQRRPKKNQPALVCARADCNRQIAEYHVAGIIGKALSPIDGHIKWLIKWEGYAVTEATWEGEKALSDAKMLIGKFYQAVKREKGADFDVIGTVPLLLKEAERAGW